MSKSNGNKMVKSNRPVTATEASEIFRKSRQTIYNWLKEGRFPNHYEISSGALLIPPEDIERVKLEEAEKLADDIRKLGFKVTLK